MHRALPRHPFFNFVRSFCRFDSCKHIGCHVVQNTQPLTGVDIKIIELLILSAMIYLGIRHMGFSDPILILYIARSRLRACELVFRDAIVRMALLYRLKCCSLPALQRIFSSAALSFLSRCLQCGTVASEMHIWDSRYELMQHGDCICRFVLHPEGQFEYWQSRA